MAEQHELAVAPPGVIPALPADVALRRISKSQVRKGPITVPPGHWSEAYLLTPSRPQTRRSPPRDDRAEEEQLAQGQSDLRSILAELKRTATPPQAAPKPVVLYAEAPARRQFEPSRPRLDSPRSKHYMRSVVDTVIALEGSASNVTETQEDEVNWLCGWISSLSEKMIQQMRDAAEIFESRESWSMLAKIASGILAAISIVFGISLITTPAGGALIGGLLIASGILSIVNLILEETKAWDWIAEKIAGDDKELAAQLKVWMPAGVGMLSMAVGAAGSIGATFMHAFNMIQEMLMMGRTATDIAKHISKMGEGVATSESMKAQAEVEALQTDLDMADTHLSAALDRLKRVGRMVQRSSSATHRMIASGTRMGMIQDLQA